MSIARNILLKHSERIMQWIHEKNNQSQTVLYSSIDVRESNLKITPVDINLYPSGFNNFSNQINELKARFDTSIPLEGRVALLIENFTRNQNYLENVRVLQEALGGDKVQLLTIDHEQMKVINFHTHSFVNVNDFDVIILNNDLSAGCPDELLAVENRVFPSLKLGWYNRRKHLHLTLYTEILCEMFKDLNIKDDTWLFTTFIDRCENIDFRSKSGLHELAEKVGKMLQNISQKYAEHNIEAYEPHVFVKANSGTFGMGVMVVHSKDEILNINKKNRHSMSSLKHGIENADVVIQEGIPTNIQFLNANCEHVLYNVCERMMGKLIRCNHTKSNTSNLNSVGMKISVWNDIDIIDSIVSGLTHLVIKKEQTIIENL